MIQFAFFCFRLAILPISYAQAVNQRKWFLYCSQHVNVSFFLAESVLRNYDHGWLIRGAERPHGCEHHKPVGCRFCQ
jgi:hypothetical protein